MAKFSPPKGAEGFFRERRLMSESDYRKVQKEIARERRAEVREQMKGLRGRALIEYIWAYYKYHIILSVFGLILLISLVSAMVTGPKLDRPGVLISINGGGQYEAWFDAFEDWLGIDPEKEQVTATTEYVYGESSSFDYSAQMAIMVHMAAGEYDCIIGDGLMLDYTLQTNIARDLEVLLTGDLRELAEDRFVYGRFVSTDDETGQEVYGEEHAYAVDITDTKFVSQCGITAAPSIFVIPESGMNTDDALALLRYILTE